MSASAAELMGRSRLTPSDLVRARRWDEISRLCLGAWSDEPQD
jgi:hypothetical protein